MAPSTKAPVHHREPDTFRPANNFCRDCDGFGERALMQRNRLAHNGCWRRTHMVQRAGAPLEQIHPSKDNSAKEVKRASTGKDTSFMRSLCMGYIEEYMLLPFPAMSAEERETLQGVV